MIPQLRYIFSKGKHHCTPASPYFGPGTTNHLDQTLMEIFMRTLLQDSSLEIWKATRSAELRSQDIPYGLVAESFTDWMMVHLVYRILKMCASPSISNILQRIFEIFGKPRLFPSIPEVEMCLAVWLKLWTSSNVADPRAESPSFISKQRLFHGMISRYATNRSLIRTWR